MKTRKMRYLTGLIFFFMMKTAASFAGAGGDVHGFKLIEKKFVKEVNAEVYYYEHVKSGARLVKIDANDPNKTFAIGFKTFPLSDNGTPHIMEHSVLNGSRNFPVKSPFDVLQKGSLSTFMNAFTSKDFTMYPVASMNDKDYFNLMHVYLDAVFNPMIYVDDRILKQEGWHYELEDTAGPLVYKGVVYNEMKGAYSNPQRELWYQVFKNLFPESPYGFESGGHPSAIPTLTSQEFLNYHKKFYHPENSFIFLYGDAEAEKEMEFLDKEYLSNYSRTGDRAEIPDQKPFAERKRVVAYYPALEGTDTKDQTYLTLSIVAGYNTDMALTMSLDIICDVLVNQETAPLRLALQQAGIGKDVSASVSNYKQNVIQITINNANPGDKEKFEKIVYQVLNDVIAGGISKKDVEGVLNRMEFHLREGNDAQKGWTYINQIVPGWFFAGDPYRGLEYEAPLAEVKTALTTQYLENIVKKYMLNNPHSLILSLEPKPGLDKENTLMTEEKLKNIKEDFSAAELNTLVQQTRDLVEYQQREDTPAALATIPLLDISDINPKSEFYTAEEIDVKGTKLLFHEEFTNDVIYMNLFFDARVIPSEQIPYLSLLANFIGMLSTENYDYGDLNSELNVHTGGFFTSMNTYLEQQNDDLMLPKFKVSSKVMKNKLDKLTALASEILLKTRYDDRERMKNLLVRHLSQLEANVKRDGYSVASSRATSYFSKSGLFNEQINGLDYYWFVADLVKNFDNQPDHAGNMLKSVAENIFTRTNLTATVICSRKDLPDFSEKLTLMASAFPVKEVAHYNWNLTPRKLNEGITTTSKVQYVVEGYNYKKLGYSWDGKMRVLGQVLSTDWLQTRIRVIGGAYGGWCSFANNGTVTFNSYRDPNLKETLDNYKGSVDYLKNFSADKKSMTRYIIGTIATIDKPLTPSQKGEQAFSYYFSKRTREDVQRDRSAILATTSDDIRSYSKLVEDVIGQGTYCVYGNSDRLNGNKELFEKLIKTDR